MKLSLPPGRQGPLRLPERLHSLEPRPGRAPAPPGPSKLQETRKIFEQRTLQVRRSTAVLPHASINTQSSVPHGEFI